MAIVRILPQAEGNSTSKMVTVDVVRSAKTERMIITSPRDLTVNLGDAIRCLSGFALAMMNPGTQAGVYLLTPRVPYGTDAKYVTNLVISPQTLRIVERGHITSAQDIGTVMTSTGAVTR
jgi:hypothetical protein